MTMENQFIQLAEFRSFFINIQIIKSIKISDNIRIYQGIYIESKDDIYIKLIDLNNNSYDKNNYIDSYKILSILNLKYFPKVLINKRILNYQIIVQTIADGVSLGELNIFLSYTEIFKIFKELFRLILYLFNIKIKIAELQENNIFVDSNGNIKLNEITWMCFEDNINENYENIQTRSLIRIVNSLILKQNNDIKSIKNEEELDSFVHINNLQTIASQKSRILTFEYINNTYIDLDNNNNYIDLNNSNINNTYIDNINSTYVNYVNIIDPLVLKTIDNLGFNTFNYNLINNIKSHSYHIYRLVDNNVIRSNIPGNCKNYHHLMDNLNKIRRNKNNYNINMVESYIFKTLFKKYEEKDTIIRERMAELCNLIVYPTYFYRFMNCCMSSDICFIEILSFKVEKLKKIFKYSKYSIIYTENKIKIRDDSKELFISVKIKKKTADLVSIIFKKENGREIDFLKVISEIIEDSRRVN